MATKLILISILLLQLTAVVLSKYRTHGGHHKKPSSHEPWGLAGGIPGGPVEGFPSQPRGPGGKIPTPCRAQGGVQGKKWCVGNKDVKKGLLKEVFENLCKEVDCLATGPKGICYDKSIWSKASYAMNLKYQKNGQKNSDCNYEGRAKIVTTDPSWGKCVLISS